MYIIRKVIILTGSNDFFLSDDIVSTFPLFYSFLLFLQGINAKYYSIFLLINCVVNIIMYQQTKSYLFAWCFAHLFCHFFLCVLHWVPEIMHATSVPLLILFCVEYNKIIKTNAFLYVCVSLQILMHSL